MQNEGQRLLIQKLETQIENLLKRVTDLEIQNEELLKLFIELDIQDESQKQKIQKLMLQNSEKKARWEKQFVERYHQQTWLKKQNSGQEENLKILEPLKRMQEQKEEWNGKEGHQLAMKVKPAAEEKDLLREDNLVRNEGKEMIALFFIVSTN